MTAYIFKLNKHAYARCVIFKKLRANYSRFYTGGRICDTYRAINAGNVLAFVFIARCFSDVFHRVDHVSDDSHCARGSTDIRHDMLRSRKDILLGITRSLVQLYLRIIFI